jgi:hypothetical protein
LKEEHVAVVEEVRPAVAGIRPVEVELVVGGRFAEHLVVQIEHPKVVVEAAKRRMDWLL